MNHLHKIETESFASLYMSAAAALVEEHDFEGKIALRQCIRLYGTRLGQLRRNMLVNAGQKTNLVLTEQWEKARKPLKILGKTGVMR